MGINNKFIKRFKLKQITPMVHFQYAEDGATIRASELKPKFDKFIRSIATNSSMKRTLAENINMIPNALSICKTLEEIKNGESNYFQKDT